MKRLLIVACLLGATMPAVAYEPTAEEKAACEPDAYSLCAGAMLNVLSKKPIRDRVYDCLKSNKAKLSPACRAVFRVHGQ